ncbi:MAG: PLDc N-terminal domain-containing protein [Bacillales bacterium]
MDALLEHLPLIVPLVIVQLLLMIIAVIDLIRIEKTNGPKWVWALVVVLVNLIGPILYFIFGRRND